MNWLFNASAQQRDWLVAGHPDVGLYTFVPLIGRVRAKLYLRSVIVPYSQRIYFYLRTPPVDNPAAGRLVTSLGNVNTVVNPMVVFPWEMVIPRLEPPLDPVEYR